MISEVSTFSFPSLFSNHKVQHMYLSIFNLSTVSVINHAPCQLGRCVAATVQLLRFLVWSQWRTFKKKKSPPFFFSGKQMYEFSDQFITVCSCNLLGVGDILQFFFVNPGSFVYSFIICTLCLRAQILASRNTNYCSSRANRFSRPKVKCKELKLLVFTQQTFLANSKKYYFEGKTNRQKDFQRFRFHSNKIEKYFYHFLSV